MYDGRCVGSLPTVRNGMFVDKNKVKDREGNIQDTSNTVTLPPNAWTSYTRPTDWTSDDTGCYDTDTNYTIDENALSRANIKAIGQNYWLASHTVPSDENNIRFSINYIYTNGAPSAHSVCVVLKGGDVNSRSISQGLRPCFSLRSNGISIISGDGQSIETAYTIGK